MLQASTEDEGDVPVDYQRVDYLENSGTQWIATDYRMTAADDVQITVDFAFTAPQTVNGVLFGCMPGKLREQQVFLEYYGGDWYAANGKWKGNNTSDIGSVLNVRHHAVISSHMLTIDGIGISTIATNLSIRDLSTMYLFAWHQQSGAKDINQGVRIYNLKFVVNGITEANFVPVVQQPGNRAGMFDTISQKFYTNSGTGHFITGSAV